MKPFLGLRHIILKYICIIILCKLYLIHFVASVCPNECSHHGDCTSVNPEYGVCVCEIGYTSSDCSERLCPKSFNAMTLSSFPGRRQVRFDVSHKSGAIGGEIAFGFLNDEVELPASASLLTAKVCTERLNTLKSVDNVTCDIVSQDLNSGEGSYLVTFHSFPTQPYENNIVGHTGNPHLTFFSCNTTNMNKITSKDPTCKLTDVKVVSKIPEYLPCGGPQAGSCIATTGTCVCNKGFFGYACDDILDNGDIDKITLASDVFSGTALRLHATRNSSANFNFMQFNFISRDKAETDAGKKPGDFMTPAFLIRGDGLMDQRFGTASFLKGGEVRSKKVDDQYQYHQQQSMSMKALWTTQLSSPSANTDSATAIKIVDKKVEDMTKSAINKGHILAVSNKKLALSISKSGDVATSGKFASSTSSEAAAGMKTATFSADLDMASAITASIANDMQVEGSMNIGDSVVMGVNLAVSSSGITIDSSIVTDDSNSVPHTLLNIKANSDVGNHSIVEIRSSSSIASKSGDHISTSLFKASVDNSPVFDITSVGDFRLNRLAVESGIEIDTGGILIEEGGLDLGAGSELFLKSGSLQYLHGHLDFPRIHVSGEERSFTNVHLTKKPLMQLVSNNTLLHPSTTVAIDIKVHKKRSDSQKLPADSTSVVSVRQLLSGNKSTVTFSISDGGTIDALDVNVGGSIIVQDGSMFNGISFRNHVVTVVNNSLRLPASSSFITVMTQEASYSDIHEEPLVTEVIISAIFVDDFGIEKASFEEGKVIIIRNGLSQAHLIGPLIPKIPPKVAICLVFDGSRFVDIQAFKSAVRNVKDLTRLTAANDIHLGNNVSFSAFRLASHKLSRTSVPFVSNSISDSGSSKSLADSPSLVYAKSQLSTPTLAASKIMGDVDLSSSALNNIALTIARFDNSRLIESASIKVTGAAGGYSAVDNQGAVSSTNTNIGTTGSAASRRPIHGVEGRFKVSDLEEDVQLHRFTLNNIGKVSANVLNSREASFDNLKLSSLKGVDGSLVYLDEVGFIKAVGSSIVTKEEKGEGGIVTCQSAISGIKMQGDISFGVGNSHKISNLTSMHVLTARDVNQVHASSIGSISLKQMQQHPTMLVSDLLSGKVDTLVVRSSIIQPPEKLRLNKVAVGSNVGVEGSLLGRGDIGEGVREEERVGGSKLRGIKVDLSGVDWSASSSTFKTLSVDHLFLKSDHLTSLSNGATVDIAGNTQESLILGGNTKKSLFASVNKDGELSLEDQSAAKFEGGAIHFQHLRVNNEIAAKSLILNSEGEKSYNNAPLLSVNTATLELETFNTGSIYGTLTVSRDVQIAESASMHLGGIRSTSLLAVDGDGVLTDAIKYNAIAGDAALSLDKLSVKLLYSQNVKSTKIEANHMQFSDPLLLLEANKKISEMGTALLAINRDRSDEVNLISDISAADSAIVARTSVTADTVDTESLHLGGSMVLAPEFSSVVLASSDGAVLTKSRLSLSSVESVKLDVKSDMLVGDSLVVHSLLQQKTNSVVVASDRGLLEADNALDLKYLAVISGMTVSGVIISDDIYITAPVADGPSLDKVEVEVGGVLVVDSDSGGGLAAVSNSIHVNSVKSSSITTSSKNNKVWGGEMSTDSLRIKSLLPPPALSSSASVLAGGSFHVLSASSDGIVGSVSSDSLLSHFKLPIPEVASFGEIQASKGLIVSGELHLKGRDSASTTTTTTTTTTTNSGGAVVWADGDGNVKTTTVMALESLEVHNSVDVLGTLNLKSIGFPKSSSSSYLMNHGPVAVDSKGGLYTVNDITFSSNGVISVAEELASGSNSIGLTLSDKLVCKQATIDNLSDNLDVGNQTLRRLHISKSHIASSEIQVASSRKSRDSGEVLFRESSSGKLSISSGCVVDSSDGILKISNSISSIDDVTNDGVGNDVTINSDKFLHIDHSRLKNSVIHSSKLSNVASVQSDRIDFTGMEGEDSNTVIFVNGPLLVQGSVRGTGSYIENSDIRLKKDIKNVSGNVLERVRKLQAVSYFNRVDEFPAKRLSSAKQVGWIADEVKEVFPELVVTDPEGFLAITYDRSFALLFEALKESKANLDAKFEGLDRRLTNLGGGSASTGII